MKLFKTITVIFSAILMLSLASCKSNGDLGRQTTVDTENGYTLIQEVKSYKLSDDEKLWKNIKDIQSEKFVTDETNKTGNIKTKSDALSIAKSENISPYNSIRMYYDRTRGVWKVVFSNDEEITDEKGNKSVSGTVSDTVYVDEDGYTLALFHGEVK